MAIGIVDDSEFDKEFESLIINNEILEKAHLEVEIIERGRGLGNNNIPNAIRKIISDSSINGESPDDISKAFGVSKSSISAYKNGSTSTSSYNDPKKELLDHNAKVRNIITRKSRKLLLRAIDHIDDDKLKGTKAIELASIAKNMSGIMKDMHDSNNPNGNTINNRVVVFIPRKKEEDEFEILDVRE